MPIPSPQAASNYQAFALRYLGDIARQRGAPDDARQWYHRILELAMAHDVPLIPVALHGTADEGHVLLAVEERFVHVAVELAPPRGQRDALDPLDELLALQAVADQVRDRAHLHVVHVAELLQLRPPRHLAVGAHDLADDGRGLEAGHAGEVDAALGLAGADEHPAVACDQVPDSAVTVVFLGGSYAVLRARDL